MQSHSIIPPENPSTQSRLTFGLSKDHKRPRLSLTLARGGNMVEVKSTGWPGRVTSTTTRGDVTTFSARSRRRCLKTLACIDRRRHDKPPLFLTLTYPESWPNDPAILKRDLAVLWKRLRKRFPWVSAIWRIELQERGAPHYHLLLFGLSFMNHAYLARAWYEVVGSGDAGHLTAGTEVRACRTWSMAAAYVAKYLAKVTDTDEPVSIGRHWGIVGRSNLPRDLITLRLDWPQYFALKAELESRLWPSGDGPPERGEFCGCWVAWPGWEDSTITAILIDTYIVSAVESLYLD